MPDIKEDEIQKVLACDANIPKLLKLVFANYRGTVVATSTSTSELERRGMTDLLQGKPDEQADLTSVSVYNALLRCVSVPAARLAISDYCRSHENDPATLARMLSDCKIVGVADRAESILEALRGMRPSVSSAFAVDLRECVEQAEIYQLRQMPTICMAVSQTLILSELVSYVSDCPNTAYAFTQSCVVEQECRELPYKLPRETRLKIFGRAHLHKVVALPNGEYLCEAGTTIFAPCESSMIDQKIEDYNDMSRCQDMILFMGACANVRSTSSLDLSVEGKP